LVVKTEFLANLDGIANHQAVSFVDCTSLGDVNLQGTGFAARQREMRSTSADRLSALPPRPPGELRVVCLGQDRSIDDWR
jgi:hypothetical protein